MPPFDPYDFFRLAEQLAKDADNEAAQRSAISRAYYACHLTARDRIYGLDKAGLSRAVRRRIAGDRRVGDHEAIVVAVAKNTTFKRGAAKKLSDQLSELQELRELADYLRDTDGAAIQDSFEHYRAKDWNGLARTALALTTNVLPEVMALRP
jgi:hypothetical protein